VVERDESAADNAGTGAIGAKKRLTRIVVRVHKGRQQSRDRWHPCPCAHRQQRKHCASLPGDPAVLVEPSIGGLEVTPCAELPGRFDVSADECRMRVMAKEARLARRNSDHSLPLEK
jgi:hypothetical protein